MDGVHNAILVGSAYYQPVFSSTVDRVRKMTNRQQIPRTLNTLSPITIMSSSSVLRQTAMVQRDSGGTIAAECPELEPDVATQTLEQFVSTSDKPVTCEQPRTLTTHGTLPSGRILLDPLDYTVLVEVVATLARHCKLLVKGACLG